MNLQAKKNQIAIAIGVLVLSLVSILLNQTFFTSAQQGSVNESSLSNSDRQIASVGNIQEQVDLAWQKNLAQRLSNPVLKQKANFGHRPDKWAEFEFGALNGHYRLSKKEGSVTAVEFFEEVSEDQAVTVEPEEFLTKYKDLIHPQADHVGVVQGSGQNRSYDVYGAKGQVLGQVQMSFNTQGALLKMEVSSK